jgi:septal ring-binding cell division protein DamX
MAADEGLHEIQLNGKQLVFLFMSSTVVAVVIFLCGVMVGRGVQVRRPAEAIEATAEAAADPTAPATPASSTALTAPVTSNAPVAAQETLTYPSRLEGQEPPEENLRPATTAKRTVATAKATPKATRPAGEAAASSAIPREPAGNGFVVQVAAVNDRHEAETIASRLAGKGYPSFVTTPPNSTARTFRVRIGKYPTRREAEAVATRLQKEDQFKPWITK